jgi:hypothetical protein
MSKPQRRLQKAQPKEKLRGQDVASMLQQIEHEAPSTGLEDPPSIEPQVTSHSVKISRSHPKTAQHELRSLGQCTF